jgi:hypothetical protein
MIQLKINKTLLKHIFINILILFFVSLITISIINNNVHYREGFNINDINKVVKEIENVTDLTREIPNQIRSIDNKVVGKVNAIGNQLNNNLQNLGQKIENNAFDKIKYVGGEIEKNTVGKVSKLASEVEDNVKNLGQTIEKNTIDKVSKLGEQLEKKTLDKLTNLGKQIEKKTVDQMKTLGNEIEKNTVDFFTKKLKSIFTQLGDIFNDGLIKPINDLFMGIGNIFVQIFGILQEIGNKIVQLPTCMLTYMIKSTADTVNYAYNKIMPKALQVPLSFIYKYTLGLIVEFIANITGFNDSVNKCYGFNVKSEITNIKSNLKDINRSFKDNFGDINFSKIKI